MQEEINRAKLELESLKEDTLEKHKNNERIRVLLDFIGKSQPFSLRIVYEFIKRIYRLKDNSLLVIFSKRTLSDEEYQTILNSDISSLTLHEFNYNNRKIKYRIKNMEEEIC